MISSETPLRIQADGPASAAPATSNRPTFLGVVRSEWTELRRRKGSALLLGLSVAVMTAVSGLSAAALMAGYEGPTELVNEESVHGLPTVGLYLGQLLIATLGVLVVTSGRRAGPEDSPAASRSRRTALLLARGMALGLAGAVVGVVSRLAGYILIQPILAQHDLDFALGSAEFWTSLVGAGLYFALIAIMAAGIGSLIGNRAAAVFTVIGLLFIAPMVLWLIPGEGTATAVNYLPSEAGTQLMLAEAAAGDLTPVQGGLLLAAWALLPFLAAAYRLSGRTK